MYYVQITYVLLEIKTNQAVFYCLIFVVLVLKIAENEFLILYVSGYFFFFLIFL